VVYVVVVTAPQCGQTAPPCRNAVALPLSPPRPARPGLGQALCSHPVRIFEFAVRLRLPFLFKIHIK